MSRNKTRPKAARTRTASIDLLILCISAAEVEEVRNARTYVMTEARTTFLANPNRMHGGYARIANVFLENSSADVVGIIHADTHLRSGDLAILAENATSGGGRITGIVGRSLDQEIVWGCHGGGEVSTLDSCAVFIPRIMVPDLRFDAELFDDFHCCVEDLCLQAAAIGLSTYVPVVGAQHTGSSISSPEWLERYHYYRALLAEKWSHVIFATT